MNPIELNLFITLGTLIFFLVQGLFYFRRDQTETSYFLVDRNLSSKEYSYSFAAASTSLSTVLFFFTILGLEFGLYIFWAPLTYFAGVKLFNVWLLPKIDAQQYFGKEATQSQDIRAVGSTLGNYLLYRLNSRLLKYTVIILTLIGMLSILLIELYVGTTIFSIYIREEAINIGLVALTLVVFAYTTLGGFQAVIKTDKVQYFLILIATLVFIGWLIIELFEKKKSLALHDFFPPTIEASQGILLPYPLLLNIFVVNILLIPALLRTWQMLAASPNMLSVKKGNVMGARMTFLLTVAFVLIGILFFKYVFPLRKEDGPPSLIMIFTKLVSFPDTLGPYIVFPVFFAACIAALLSTADSALMPLMQSFAQDFSKGQSDGKLSFKKIGGIACALLLLTLGLYFVVFKVLKYDLISWLYTIFGFLTICSPLIIFAIVCPDKILNRKYTSFYLFIVLAIGAIGAVALSIYGNNTKNLDLVMLSTPIGCGFISILYYIYYRLYKVPNVKRNTNG